MSETVDVVRAAGLDGIAHGFLGRKGGVSRGDVAGLNVGLGSGDDPASITENRRRAVAAIAPGAQFVTVYQVHSPDCVVAAEPWADDARPRADAIVTDRPGLVLGILTADCAPVLLADREAGVVGAAHAGWKGAVAGVTDRTIEGMEGLGARAGRIVAAVGPCIAQESYEVDAAFHDRLVELDAANADLLEPGAPEHFQFDLEGYVARRLAARGLARVERLGLDTYANEDRFYSFRRATHRHEPSYGRQISLIGLS